MFFYHTKSAQKGPRVTVVGELVDHVLKIAVARCSNNDSFSKARGRELAKERLANNTLIASIPNIPEDCGKKFLLIAKSVSTKVLETKKISK